MNRGNGLAKNIAYGMIGGLVGTFALGQIANFLYKLESEEKKKKEESLRKEDPAEAMARRLSEDVFGCEISDEVKSKLGRAIHWGTGLAAGGVYGALRDRLPAVSKPMGLPYGAVFFLVVDEGLNTALKLTPPPQEFPIDAHVRGLVAHLVYAATVEVSFRFLKKVAG